MNIIEYISKQFRKPTGIGGNFSTFIMNRINQRQYYSVINTLNISKQDKILDIGFGNGYLLQKLAKEHLCQYFGIEISDDMIKIAKNRNSEFVKKGIMTLEKGDITNTLYKDNYFDKIYTVNTIYFWSDMNKGLSEIKRILKPNGIFINAFYTKEYLDKIRYTKFGFAKYTSKELENIMLQNGFEIVDIIEIKFNISYCIVLRKK